MTRDIFVSYAHDDNTEEWVGNFVADLKESIETHLQRPPNVYLATENMRNGSLYDILKSGVYKSSLLIVILSENSLSSDWCRLELATFSASNLEAAWDKRIFPVLYNVAASRIATHLLLGNQRVYDFADKSGPTTRRGDAYTESLKCLSEDIADFLGGPFPSGNAVSALLISELHGRASPESGSSGSDYNSRAIRVHNELVKCQLTGRGEIVNEFRDTVVAAFRGHAGWDQCLTTAKRIQQAINLYNLLFPTRRLQTKVAVTYCHSDELSLVDSSAVFPNGGSCITRDYAGTAMDRLAGIARIAKPNEILISAEIGYTYHYDQFNWLSKTDPSRHCFIPEVGRLLEVGSLKWKRFLLTGGLGEVVAEFEFDKIEDYMGPRQQQLHNSCRSGLRMLKVNENEVDILLAGQSLSGWIPHLKDYIKPQDSQPFIGAVKMAPEQKGLLELITPPSAARNSVIASLEPSHKEYAELCQTAPAKLDVRIAPAVPEDTWAFWSLKSDKVFSDSPSESVKLRIPYDLIAEAFLDEQSLKTWRVFWGQNSSQIEELGGNLPVEVCVHDVLFGAAPSEATSTVFALDWLNAVTAPQKSRYLQARRKCQHSYDNSQKIGSVPPACMEAQ